MYDYDHMDVVLRPEGRSQAAPVRLHGRYYDQMAVNRTPPQGGAAELLRNCGGVSWPRLRRCAGAIAGARSVACGVGWARWLGAFGGRVGWGRSVGATA